MEALVGGEETLCKPVPAITKFIHLVRPERVHVGKRDQLYPGRGEGIETGQLATRGCQGEREGLNTVTEEIAAGQQVIPVEAVVDLGDEARKLVERGGYNRSHSVRRDQPRIRV